ncbi:MAG: hypothetical protein ACYDCK_13670 [Thermoplasmatota archaeon]
MSEPSTAFDRSASGQTAMWQFANDGKTQPMKERIYFDGIFLSDTTVGADPNLDGGRVTDPAEGYFMAFLGYWRDCNADGYIGNHAAPLAGGNLAQYPSSLLDAAGLVRCPRGSPYNDGTLVDEFRWIGPDASPNTANANWDNCVGNPLDANGAGLVNGCHKNVNDVSDCAGSTNQPGTPTSCGDTAAAVGPHSKVWSDWGITTRPIYPRAAIYPWGRGTFEDTDGTLTYVDDLTFGITNYPPAGCPNLACEVDSVGGSGAWAGKPCIGNEARCVAPQQADPTYQVKRLWNDSTSDQQRGTDFVTVWDYNQNSVSGQSGGCNSDQIDGAGVVGTPMPAPKVDPSGRVLADPTNAGSIDATLADNTRPDIILATSGDGHTGYCTQDGQHLAPWANLETDSQVSFDTVKAGVDDFYAFSPDAGRTDLASPAGLPTNLPEDLGTGALGGPSGVVKSGAVQVGWFDTGGWVMERRESYLKFTYATFYAELTPNAISNDTYAANSAATALPAGALHAHTYASENCPTGFGSYVGTNGWNCDPAAWAAHNGVANGVVAGEKYDLRDVDCYDNRAFDINNVAGPSLSAAPLTDTANPSCAVV